MMINHLVKSFENFKELSSQWNTFRDKGTKIMSTLVNKHLKVSYIDLYDFSDSIKENTSLQFKYKQSQFNDLISCYEKLNSTILELKAIVEKINENLSGLSVSKKPKSYQETIELKLYEYYEDIIKMYNKSLDNKQQIINNIMNTEDRDQLLILITCWSNDIHINNKTIDLVEEIFKTENNNSSLYK
ncbi:hypothetical protein ACTFIR_005394 [Dictyostelium discoideum]